MSACPARCGRHVRVGNLLCAPCWHAVPREMQVAVWRTWRAWQNERGALALIADYKRARDAAIAAAREKITQREFDLPASPSRSEA